jgi:hypothetical protein
MGLAIHGFHDTQKTLPPSRVADGQMTWAMLILDYMENSQIKNLWQNELGCFYDQAYETRTAIVPEYFCPSQQHEGYITLLPDGSGPDDGSHGHPAKDPFTGQNWAGSISDYRAVIGSTCPTPIPELGTSILDLNPDGGFGHLSDGAMPQVNARDKKVTYLKLPASPRGVATFRHHVALKNITDGTSKTLLVGECGRGTSESGMAFSGDKTPGLQIGEGPRGTLCEKCELSPAEGGDAGFGSVHAGVIQFIMCDASVQQISNQIDPKILDAMATRAGGELYDINGTIESCRN